MNAKITLTLLSLSLASGAVAQDNSNQSTMKKAENIATQPARDVGIEKTKIPSVLTDAVRQPYAAPAPNSCKGITADIAELNEALGPDFTGNPTDNEDKFGRLASAGAGAVVNSLIPFRGLVREVSGAAPAERRLDAAINAGTARRGYLRGLAQAKGCKLPPPPAPDKK